MGESLSPGAGEVGPCLSPVLGPLSGPGVCVSGAGVPPPPPPVGCIPPHPHIPPHVPPHVPPRPCVSPRPCLGTVRGGAVAGGVGGEFMMEGKKKLKSFRSE